MNPPPNPPKNKERLQQIPPVQEILESEALRSIPVAQQYLIKLIREETDRQRRQIMAGKQQGSRAELSRQIIQQVVQKAEKLLKPAMKKVINATGIILHTNLGRAPLAPEALQHLQIAADHYCNLEIELDSGRRGNRVNLVEEIICLITGAEAALVVNNNAAAILLALTSLARRREVVVSRGEQVEIGGSFRMPEVMRLSGARMVEVGTTNKTHLRDYREAITAKTGAILKVHTSNYRVMGFTGSVSLPELAELCREHDIPLIYDMGSGVIEDLRNWGYPQEPVARQHVAEGVDVITFSGDKILGGPQSGIIIGKKNNVQKIKKNHLLRALRCDKLNYALLDVTLRMYLQPENLPERLPVARLLNRSSDEMQALADKLARLLQELPLQVNIEPAYSEMGSGALPLEKIPSLAVTLQPQKGSLAAFSRKLRLADPAVVGYIENERLSLNLRTVREDEIELIARAVRQVVC
ncbi:MAG: L-seryl-tRNA(Sec) selenium transferase [Calditrichia bacterium]